MTSSLRLLMRAGFLLLVLVLFGIGLVLAWFTSWRSEKIAALDAVSEIVQTNAGAVEFLARGEGPAVLVFHGAPGGYDQAMLLGSNLLDQGFQIVAPSRPGYLRTPLATGLLPEQQADAMAALLDNQGLSSVAVVGSSAGAPAAIEFALRHPGRVWALVLISAVTKPFAPHAPGEAAEPGRAVLRGLTGDVGAWFCVEMAQRDPARLLAWTEDVENRGDAAQKAAITNYVLGSAGQLEWFRALFDTFAPLSPRESGTRNDLLMIWSLKKFPFEKITAPTLIVHGTMDKFVPFADAREVSGRIPNATLLAVEGAGHLVQLGPQGDEVQKKIREFLSQYSAGHSQP